MDTSISSDVPGKEYIQKDVQYSFSAAKHDYHLPRTSTRRTQRPFHKLEDALWALESFATSTEQDELNTALSYACRRLRGVFSIAYDMDSTDKFTLLPTPTEFLSELKWVPESHTIPPRTITVEKTEDEVLLTYSAGFEEMDYTMELHSSVEEQFKGKLLQNCGKGVKAIHAPYDPSISEEWRYKPSKVQFAYEQTDEGTLRIGISSNPPSTPWWYHIHKRVFLLAGPYAKVTFNVDEQTRTVRHLLEDARSRE